MGSRTLAMPNAAAAVSSHLEPPAAPAREALLLRQDPAPSSQQREAMSSRWLPSAGFVYLTFSSGMALHRSWGDAGALAFIAFAYVDLLLLFYCLRRYERAEPGSAVREWLKLAVWLLTSALTILFSYKVAAVMPAAAAAIVWVMGLATVCGGFVAFFCLKKTA